MFGWGASCRLFCSSQIPTKQEALGDRPASPLATVAIPARAPAQQELDELLFLLDCAHRAHENLTRCRIFRRAMERATEQVEQLREHLRGAMRKCPKAYREQSQL